MIIKKGDNVVVLKGKDKGKKGKVERVFPDAGKALVAGINVVTKHQKPKQGVKQVGRLTKSMPMNAANLALFCDKCGKHVRVGYKILANGDKTRVCKKCGDII
ncbi:MAG: 50S ribosomal protein L24 [Patescibacteria group bacterium]|nr:50S ribosomal protein L24 [Patescibacteria group bacterium]